MTIVIKAFASYNEIIGEMSRVPKRLPEFDIKIEGYDNLTYHVEPNWTDNYEPGVRQHDWGFCDCLVDGKYRIVSSLAREIEATASIDPQIIADAEAEIDFRYDNISEIA